ncbi:Stk1 family PASTA domain-containing Ser/Thr kinase [Thalassobacillus pellis]|uniref:Stk1 family PASTA domain-containing Ser/Thr kinase n=1 Tax=Thalassobacillus pellis TaxID=748008 RepID=UPI00195F5B12|nr:Stk1 family PASTA domain-containing Ser/Thr kinase [Thalassobacillus pellis]MBM7552809.1 serine/threonine-protein kinase [Thalassobacillus pellis]
MLNNRLLNERYLLKEMIGGGGMANVYLAQDTILEREVAIKVLRLEYGNDEEFIARFHREAQSATSLSHPNIVNIYDVGEEEDIYYMVMEHIDGMTLKKYIQTNSPVDVNDAIDIMHQVTSAIGHAHDNGIVHRDIKPENILIDHYGQVKVTDFGIAMALSATALTQTNSILGSVHYLSPEQARGGVATKKSDIYSIGIVFFELLTGRLPFSGESAVSVALKHLQNDTPSLKRWNPDLPQSVENVVLKATAKDPFHRYAYVQEMEEDLDTALDPERYDEPPFVPEEDDDGEKTKAIPVITQEAFKDQQHDETIIHTNGGNTKNVPITDEVKKDEKKDKNKTKKKKKKVWGWLLGILLFLVAAGIAAIIFLPELMQPKDVEMIDVTGMEYEEAYSKLRNLNLKVERETVYSDTVEEGFVVKTDPNAGMVTKEGATVTVFSSRGKEKMEFGDYVGEEFEKIKAELEAKGYKNILPIRENSDQPAGEIIEQIQPQPDEQVVPEEARVIFKVSSGPPTVMLKPLKNLSQQEAESYLTENELNMKVSEDYSDSVEEGMIISQSPAPYTEVEQGSTIEVVVSKGQKEQPPRTENVSVTVPYTAQPEEEPQDENNGEGNNNENGNKNGEGNENNENKNKQDPNESPPAQEVIIYIEDMEHDISEVYRKETITEDTTFEFPLTIAPGTEASYKVLRGEEVVEEATIPY